MSFDSESESCSTMSSSVSSISSVSSYVSSYVSTSSDTYESCHVSSYCSDSESDINMGELNTRLSSLGTVDLSVSAEQMEQLVTLPEYQSSEKDTAGVIKKKTKKIPYNPNSGDMNLYWSKLNPYTVRYYVGKSPISHLDDIVKGKVLDTLDEETICPVDRFVPDPDVRKHTAFRYHIRSMNRSKYRICKDGTGTSKLSPALHKQQLKHCRTMNKKRNLKTLGDLLSDNEEDRELHNVDVTSFITIRHND